MKTTKKFDYLVVSKKEGYTPIKIYKTFAEAKKAKQENEIIIKRRIK